MTDSTTPAGPDGSSGAADKPAATGSGDDTTPATAGATPAAPSQRPRKRNLFARHKILTALAVVLLLIAGAAGAYAYWLNSQIGDIPRADMGIEEPPAHLPPEKDRGLNLLLLGADGGRSELSVAEDLEDGKWTPFEHRSDTVMIVHLPADRDSAQVISIPRDTWVKIDGYPAAGERAKLNAAFAYGGPALARQTVEELTGIRIDHMAVIDWQGFRDLTSALGGIRVYIPETFTDSKQDITWEEGWTELEGEAALKYVRTRDGIEEGDIGRIKRQQNFLRATLGELLSSGTTRNPVKVGKVVGGIGKYLTVDNTWDNSEIRDLALSLRGLKNHDVEFLTIPNSCCDTSPDGQSIIRVDKKQTDELFDALGDNDIDSYLEAHPQETLEGEKQIN